MKLTPLASHLVNDGLLNYDSATNALLAAKELNVSLIHYLVSTKKITNDLIIQSCIKNFNLQTFDLTNYDFSWLSQNRLSTQLIKQYQVIPLQKESATLYLAIADPTDRAAIDAISFHIGLNITPVIVSQNQLTDFIQKHFSENCVHHLELNLLNTIQSTETLTTPIDDETQDEPIIRFVDQLIQHAMQQTASDIHIEPYERICRIRYRKDGILYEIAEIARHLAERLSLRLKVMAKCDISERRLPQDGRFQIQSRDIRISICPTQFGEKIVLRILNTNKLMLDIDTLHFTDFQKKLFLEKISEPQGMILVTGPTGSGKTITLYTALNYLNSAEKNISTVEDPIEIQLPGINQVNIHPKIGLQFSTVLRTLLRQDPDILMIGEIRDKETAEIATQAALTGHLVLSTLHTTSALEAITRLRSMGIATYDILQSLSLIIAQRLLRKLCEYCKQSESLTLDKLLTLELDPEKVHTIYHANGCSHCLQGYQGRIAVYEFLPITMPLKNNLEANNTDFISSYMKNAKLQTLKQSGLDKVSQGITSIAELNRVLYF